jgi:hypothetical protein
MLCLLFRHIRVSPCEIPPRYRPNLNGDFCIVGVVFTNANSGEPETAIWVGGQVFSIYIASCTLQDSSVSANSQAKPGGACCFEIATVSMERCCGEGCSAQRGLFCYHSGPANARLTPHVNCAPS